MKNIIKIVLILSIGFQFSFAENNSFKIYEFKKRLLKVENRIYMISIRKELASKILIKYTIEPKKHLKNSINLLIGMLQSDKASIRSLLKQKESIQGLIKMESSRQTDNNKLTKEDIDRLINEF